VSVGCVAGIMLDFDLVGVGEIFCLAMVALYENSCTFVLRGMVQSVPNVYQAVALCNA